LALKNRSKSQGKIMDHFKFIYTHQAAEYHRMIAVEDADARLLPAIEAVLPLAGKRVLDLGSGTGRIPLLIQGLASRVAALDLHRPMLRENELQRRRVQGCWTPVEGDMRRLPFPSRWADAVIAGWAIGHLRAWYDQDWKAHMTPILQEMHRVAAPGGALIIMETLSTGALTPAPPTAGLAEYYAWLETKWDFNRTEIRTDYQFESVDEAVACTEFFFGPELADAIRQNNWARLPEWTGVWSKRL
jgi:ubiquinone/menaquinone biosynthesis C-methylase UbiE